MSSLETNNIFSTNKVIIYDSLYIFSDFITAELPCVTLDSVPKDQLIF